MFFEKSHFSWAMSPMYNNVPNVQHFFGEFRCCTLGALGVYIVVCSEISVAYLNNLFFKTSHHFYYKNKYTQASCAMDGLVRKIREQCGCIPHYFPQEKYRSRFQHSFKHIVEFNLYLCKNNLNKETVRYQSMPNVLPH